MVDLRNLEIEVGRPLAVGRFVAPSRRGKAPNDCGVRSATRSKRPPRSGRSDCDCKLRLVRPARGRSFTTFACPSVVRGCAPPTDGYDASDLLRGPFPQERCRRDYRSERIVWRNVRTHESVWREGVRCVKAKQRQGFNGNGRTDRASLHWLYVGWFDNGCSAERSYSRYSSRASRQCSPVRSF